MEIVDKITESRMSLIGYASGEEYFVDDILIKNIPNKIFLSEIGEGNKIKMENINFPEKILIVNGLSDIIAMGASPDQQPPYNAIATRHTLRKLYYLCPSKIKGVVFKTHTYTSPLQGQSISGGNTAMYMADYAISIHNGFIKEVKNRIGTTNTYSIKQLIREETLSQLNLSE